MAKALLTQVAPSSNASLTKDSPTVQCIHHWLIEPPTGPVSKGVCKKCGEDGWFHNDYPPHTRQDQLPCGEMTDESGYH